MISTSDGGMIWASVPDAAITPEAMRRHLADALVVSVNVGDEKLDDRGVVVGRLCGALPE
jgi:hypothetical protein